MPSRLTGLIRTLAWTDFPQRQGAGPAAGQIANLAHTHANIASGAAFFAPIPRTRPARFKLADTFTVDVTFVGHSSFVLAWVLGRPQQFQDDLLHHEQGHYNLAALLGRDHFVDVMLLKDTIFDTTQDGINAMDALRAQSLGKAQALQDAYDDEVHPEQDRGISNGPIQQSWDRLIQSAFTDPRTPATTAPDGTSHKVRILDVLAQSGRHV